MLKKCLISEAHITKSPGGLPPYEIWRVSLTLARTSVKSIACSTLLTAISCSVLHVPTARNRMLVSSKRNKVPAKKVKIKEGHVNGV